MEQQFGGAVFGFWGMFFGVPVVTTIKYILDQNTNRRLKAAKIKRLINKKNLRTIKRPTLESMKRNIQKIKVKN